MTKSPPAADAGETVALLLPPDLSPERVRPLAGGQLLRMGGSTMGTDWSLSAVTQEAEGAAQIRAVLEQGFAAVITQMSQWEPDSQISRFNRAEPGSRHAISPHFRAVLDCALQVAEASGGAFDPTLAGATELWGFGAGPVPDIIPSASQIARIRPPDWGAIELRDETDVLTQPGGLQLDFSAIAKGFAVDLGIAALRQLGIDHALLEIGGELKGVGVKPDGLPWWVNLESPPGGHVPAARIALTGWAVATSGSYRRRREVGEDSWSHTLDPQSGRPLGDEILSVSVLHKDCMRADALSTAIAVLGPKRGIAFADVHNIPARLVTTEGCVASTAWCAWLN